MRKCFQDIKNNQGWKKMFFFSKKTQKKSFFCLKRVSFSFKQMAQFLRKIIILGQNIHFQLFK